MNSSALGTSTSAEVTNISQHGVWIFVSEEELFMPFSEFPWFKEASVAAILELEEPRPGHLYWPQIDVDLTVESIRDPERFPLRARTSV